jgi:hypothetical protein
MAFVDPNDFEAVALEHAGAMGGTYIESEGMNLVIPNKWTHEQYATLVSVIIGGYIESLQDQNDQAIKAVQKVTSFPPLGAGEFRAFNTTGADGEFPS